MKKSKNNQISDLAREVLDDFKERKFARKNFEAQWKLNMNFYMGNQYCMASSLGEVEDMEREYFWQQQEVFNHIAPTIEERLCYLTRVRPVMTVTPVTSDEMDVKSASVSTKILDSVQTKTSLSDKIYEATKWSEICGTSFYKVAWNSALGQVVGKDENGEPIKSGEVEISVCTPFEIYPDSCCASNLDEVRSLIHAKALSAGEVKALYGLKVEGEDINVFSLGTSSELGGLGYVSSSSKLLETVKKDSVLVLERYIKPNHEFPNGRLTIVAGETVVFDGDLPYLNGVDGERGFPFVRQVCFEEVGSFWGESMVRRLIPIQRAYNAVKNRKHEFLNRLAMGVLTVEDGSVDVENLEDEGLCPGKILVYRQGATPPSFMSAGDVPNDFNSEEDRLLDDFAKMSCVMVSTTLERSNSNMSATAIQLLLDENEMRLNISAKIIQSAVKEVGRQILRLYKQFAILPRLARIVGEDAYVDVFYFNRNDISSDDVKLETESETGESMAGRRELIFKLLDAKVLCDDEGKISSEMKEKILDFVGLPNWKDRFDLSKMHTNKAQRENESMLDGETVFACEIDDHEKHILVHTARMLSSEFEKKARLSKALREKFNAHILEHRKFLGE